MLKIYELCGNTKKVTLPTDKIYKMAYILLEIDSLIKSYLGKGSMLVNLSVLDEAIKEAMNNGNIRGS